MPITSVLNQYAGINAHFQSYAQNSRDGWSSFHATQITRLNDALTQVLPRGYRAVPEQSLQLRTHERDTDYSDVRYPRPDVSILNPKRQPTGSLIADAGNLATPVAELDVDQRYTQPLPEPYEPTAVIIKKDEEEVARIEILSPKNKTGKGLDEYLEKRADALKSGVIVVEVDYLHQTKNLVPGIPDYATHTAGAFPYIISVIDPTPQPDRPNGKSAVYGFGVDEPFKPIRIPLLESDSVTVHFGEVYRHTLESVPYYTDKVDYARNPLNFESYTGQDQSKIWGRMLAIAHAKWAGTDLDTLKPPPTPYISDPAIQQVQQMGYQYAALFISPVTPEACWLVQHPSPAGKEHILTLIHRMADVQEAVTFKSFILMTGKVRQIEASCHHLENIYHRDGFAALLEHATALSQQHPNP